MSTPNPVDAYRQTKIKTANQGQLIIMLYDGAIRHVQTAIDSLAHKQHKYDVVNSSITKAQDIIGELMGSLDLNKGGDIGRNLFSLYLFMNQQLLEANLKKDDTPLQQVRKMLDELRRVSMSLLRCDIWVLTRIRLRSTAARTSSVRRAVLSSSIATSASPSGQ